ncbi:MAG: hypothetical protein M1814_006070 [Vezdaea aestivalis]|nr:MAG: hypothetical protein M1814_006070 [Vezdaea aestivalis]
MAEGNVSRWSLWRPQDLRNRRLHKAKSGASFRPLQQLNVAACSPAYLSPRTPKSSSRETVVPAPRSVVFYSHEEMTAALEQEVVRNCPGRSDPSAIECSIASPSSTCSYVANAISKTINNGEPVELPGSILLEGKGFEPASEYSIIHWGRGPEKFSAGFLDEVGSIHKRGQAPTELPSSSFPGMTPKMSVRSTTSSHDSAIGTPTTCSPQSYTMGRSTDSLGLGIDDVVRDHNQSCVEEGFHNATKSDPNCHGVEEEDGHQMAAVLDEDNRIIEGQGDIAGRPPSTSNRSKKWRLSNHSPEPSFTTTLAASPLFRDSQFSYHQDPLFIDIVSTAVLSPTKEDSGLPSQFENRPLFNSIRPSSQESFSKELADAMAANKNYPLAEVEGLTLRPASQYTSVAAHFISTLKYRVARLEATIDARDKQIATREENRPARMRQVEQSHDAQAEELARAQIATKELKLKHSAEIQELEHIFEAKLDAVQSHAAEELKASQTQAKSVQHFQAGLIEDLKRQLVEQGRENDRIKARLQERSEVSPSLPRTTVSPTAPSMSPMSPMSPLSPRPTLRSKFSTQNSSANALQSPSTSQQVGDDREATRELEMLQSKRLHYKSELALYRRDTEGYKSDVKKLKATVAELNGRLAHLQSKNGQYKTRAEESSQRLREYLEPFSPSTEPTEVNIEALHNATLQALHFLRAIRDLDKNIASAKAKLAGLQQEAGDTNQAATTREQQGVAMLTDVKDKHLWSVRRNIALVSEGLLQAQQLEKLVEDEAVAGEEIGLGIYGSRS